MLLGLLWAVAACGLTWLGGTLAVECSSERPMPRLWFSVGCIVCLVGLVMLLFPFFAAWYQHQ